MNKKAVLIIDDDRSVLRTFTRVLTKGGFEVDTAETGKEALEKAKTRSFDVALIDFRLPDMDGIDLLCDASSLLKSTIKIMITGLPSVETGSKALDHGIDAYPVKPVKPEELLSLIGEKLKAKKTQ